MRLIGLAVVLTIALLAAAETFSGSCQAVFS